MLPIVLTLVLAGCGGSSDFTGTDNSEGNSEGTEGATGAPAEPVSGDDGTVLEPQTFTVDEEVWHSKFHLIFGDGVFAGEQDVLTDDVDYTVTIDVTFENLSDLEWGMDTDKFALVSNGSATVATLASESPNVPGGLSGNGNLVFIVDETFDPVTSELVIGYSGTTRAHVPLGDGELIDLAPSQPAVSGTMSMELIDLTFTGADLDYDDPNFYETVEEGSMALTLHFDALSRRQGNWNVFAEDFALILPDGSAATPDSSVLGSLPGTEEGVPTADLSVTFLVPDPASGDYTLRLTPGDWFVGEDGVTEATFDFTIS